MIRKLAVKVFCIIMAVAFTGMVTSYVMVAAAQDIEEVEVYAQYVVRERNLHSYLDSVANDFDIQNSWLRADFSNEWEIVQPLYDEPYPLDFYVSSTRGVGVTINEFGHVIIAHNPSSAEGALATYTTGNSIAVAVYLGKDIVQTGDNTYEALINGETVALDADYVAEYHGLVFLREIPFTYFSN